MPNLDLSEPKEQQVWWSLFAGIILWFLYFNLLNALTSTGCKWGWLTSPAGGLSKLQFVELAVALVTILLIFFLIFLAWRYWRSFQSNIPRNNPNLLKDTEKHRHPLVAFIAMALNGFFAVFVLATFVPTLALKVCGQA